MQNNLQDWIGRSETALDTAQATPALALAATLDHSPQAWPTGRALPPLWHWLYFLPLHQQSAIDVDGHPRRGGFMPPVPLPRRMWAGSQFQFHAPLHIGDELRRVSTIESISDKSGRSGRLVFVKVRHQVFCNHSADAALTEFHDIVYREALQPGATAGAPQGAPAESLWQHTLVPDAVLLFRFSALTFNGHRIHYDRPYATGVEGYPGLVVHGPLIATLLLDALHQEVPETSVRGFAFKALRPSFDGQPLRLCGTPSADGRSLHLWASDQHGALAMDAHATFD
ncbi:MAG: MaoC family dehydratase N-terminal domain-containing protein [Rubrivivax sp.]